MVCFECEFVDPVQAGRRTRHSSAALTEIKSQWWHGETPETTCEWNDSICWQTVSPRRNFVAVAFCQETDIRLQEFVPKAFVSPAVHQHLHAWLLWHLALQWSYSSAAGSGSPAKWCDLDRLPLLDGGLEDLLHRELLFQVFAANPGKTYKRRDNVQIAVVQIASILGSPNCPGFCKLGMEKWADILTFIGSRLFLFVWLKTGVSPCNRSSATACTAAGPLRK